MQAARPSRGAGGGGGVGRENPDRTAAGIGWILRGQLGWAPDEGTLQRYFNRLDLPGATTPASAMGAAHVLRELMLPAREGATPHVTAVVAFLECAEGHQRTG